MNGQAAAEGNGDHDIFTEKQCEVLDLLIEHKTSKEIARELGISPYTVDQRISLARAKLGVSSRNELAAHYQTMRRAPDQLASEPASATGNTRTTFDGEGAPTAGEEIVYDQQLGTDLDEDRVDSKETEREHLPFPTGEAHEYRVGPELFEGRSGGLWRLGAVVATALLLVMMILGLFAIFAQLNDLLTT